MQAESIAEKRDVILIEPGVHLFLALSCGHGNVQFSLLIHVGQFYVDVKIVSFPRYDGLDNALYGQFGLAVIHIAIQTIASWPHNDFYFLLIVFVIIVIQIAEYQIIL